MAYNILIVDDSMIVRSVIKRTLGLCGAEIGEIHEASQGREALELLEKAWIDIVFADINMPVMNGIEMIEEMERRGMMKDVPVVIVTTERNETRIERLKAKGVRACINKPFTPEEIRDILERYLS
jgi:two-component system, chemotaxis family, chemotaxis protein CheY